MRTFLIAVVLLLGLLVGAVYYAVSNVNHYLAENRETLAGWASDAAGRTITFERAEAGFSSGLVVRLGGLRIAEDPRFGETDFLALEEAVVGVKIMPALEGRVEVSGIRLDGPEIRVIQNRHGFNFASLGASEAAEAPAEPPVDPSSTPLAVAIAALEISGGTVVYEDRTARDGLRLVIDEFESTGTELTLDGPVDIDFAGRVRSTKGADAGLSTRIAGALELEGLDPPRGRVRLKSPVLHPAIFGFRFEEGEVPERFDDFTADIRIPADAASAGYPIAARSSAARLAGFDLDDLTVDVVYRGTRKGTAFRLDEILFGLAGGRVDVRGDVLFGSSGRSPFELKTQLDGLDSGELGRILVGLPAGALSGAVGGDVELVGDSLDWESLKRSLAGSLKLDVGAGALERVNLLDSVVGKLTADPGIGRLTADSIRDLVPQQLSGNRTPFDGIDLALEISGGAIQAKDLRIAAGAFVLDAVGSVGLDGVVAADGTLRFSEELSARILARADKLAPLLGDGDQVALPLRFGGTAGAPEVLPDLAVIAGRAQSTLQDRVTEEVTSRITDQLFGRRNREASPAPSESGEGAAEGTAATEVAGTEAAPAAEGEAAAQETEPAAVDPGRDAAETLIREGLRGILGR